MVTLVEMRQLVCRAPLKQPAATDETGEVIGGDLPQAVAFVGDLRFELGLVRFHQVEDDRRVALILAAALFGVLGILLAVAFVWRRRSGQADRDYKRIQLQMETLESNVRKQCKQVPGFFHSMTSLLPPGLRRTSNGYGRSGGRCELRRTHTLLRYS